jgi:hypothetical protein
MLKAHVKSKFPTKQNTNMPSGNVPSISSVGGRNMKRFSASETSTSLSLLLLILTFYVMKAVATGTDILIFYSSI